MTPADLLVLVEKANKGDFIVYYRGSLVINQTKKKAFLRKTAYLLYEEGLVLLTQNRLEDHFSTYYAVRTSNPFKVSKLTMNEIKTMMKFFGVEGPSNLYRL